MAKLFTLGLFCGIFAVGILLGRSRVRLDVALAGRIFGCFFVVYLLLGIYLHFDTELLRPKP